MSETAQKLEKAQTEKKWTVLDEDMMEKGKDIQNWDMDSSDNDNWDDDVDF